MSGFTSKDLQAKFDITSETVRRWSEEFAQYLSPTANPGYKKTRFFTEEDVKVFALWHEMSRKGATYDDAHAELKAGERGDPGQVKRQIQTSASTEITSLQMQLIESNRRYEQAQEELGELRDKIARAEQRMQDTQQERDRVEDELKSARKRIEELFAEVAVLKYQLKSSDDE